MANAKSNKDFGIESLSAYLYLFFTRAGNEVKFLIKQDPVYPRNKNQCSDK